ncbi:uncharacterized protein MELLADRAFT_104603 [Melampsora larici-populina 98AG31]|uniref:Uncharacterized protein n=1 Tax=Melampsora larici-populina (strain 98AG31 / pathotype 3-4-7) TaxID=747676 RepID=F4RF95_MELLP|nr:uncharacterized protein MELLADRAFT_104603 [Melampsora larici-populina 98AG31]EGG08774.1 hypothetical protein MELLADRAFT_104603 [Melampsora larici-populina 98AG31]
MKPTVVNAEEGPERGSGFAKTTSINSGVDDVEVVAVALLALEVSSMENGEGTERLPMRHAGIFRVMDTDIWRGEDFEAVDYTPTTMVMNKDFDCAEVKVLKSSIGNCLQARRSYMIEGPVVTKGGGECFCWFEECNGLSVGKGMSCNHEYSFVLLSKREIRLRSSTAGSYRRENVKCGGCACCGALMGKNSSQLDSLAPKQAEKRLRKKEQHNQLCRAIVQEQHGTPSTAKVLRIHPNRPDLQERIIDHGHVILVDALTREFITSIYTLHNNDNTNKHLRAKFDWAVQILYHHGLAHKQCDINKAQEALGDAKSGEMYPTGSRGGTDKGKSGDPHASGCAIGLFCLMERDSGRVIYPKVASSSPPYHIKGA